LFASAVKHFLVLGKPALITLVMALAMAIYAQAQAQGGPDQAWFNPKPDDADLELPMPCDLTIVFKVVGIPAKGFLGDIKLTQGSLGENAKGFVDRPFSTPLSAPLRLDNFGEAYKELVSKALGDKANYQLYLIGKYEVSVGQWQAVMEGCQALGPGSELPKTALSRQDALDFTVEYMTWLTQSHPEVLPSFPSDDKYVGFVRLPTEAEWEYAARGGHAVAYEDLGKEKLFPNPNKLPLSAFAFFSSEADVGTGPKPIGSLAPNPLGLYDTAGNVSELTMDSYRVSVGSRLQGTEGGNLLKGGSYLSSGGEVLPGSRVEVPKYTLQGSAKFPFMGIRLVLSSTNAADRQRTMALQDEYASLAKLEEAMAKGQQGLTGHDAANHPAQAPATFDPDAIKAMKPVDRIRALLPFIESQGQKAALTSLLSDFERYNQLKVIEDTEQAQAFFSSVLYAAYGIRDTSLRRNMAITNAASEEAILVGLQTELKAARGAKDRAGLGAQIAERQKKIQAAGASVDDFQVALENQFAYYKSSLQYLTQFEPVILAGVAKQAKAEYQGADSYSKTMNNALDVTIRDIQLFLAEQSSKVVLDNVALPMPKIRPYK
jgi:hypothetical protein